MSDPEKFDHYAHVVDGKVVNVSVWDGSGEYDPGENVTLVVIPFTTDEDGVRWYSAAIDWDYIDGEFVDNSPVDELPNPESPAE
jgi:hypothetical protein